MTIPSTTKNALLNGQSYDFASLHTAYPGTTGASEVTGGTPAYARKAITINAASGGSRLLNAGVTFDVPACTVKWIGLWSLGVFVDALPNGGATPKNFVSIASTDLIYAPAHGWADTQKIAFFGVPPTGLTEGVTYFARDTLTDTFKVAATAGGTAIDLTGASSAGCWVVAITEDVYAIQGTHSLTAGTVTIPD